MILRVFFSVISLIAGYSGFIVFHLMKNYQASVLALITGIYSSILLHIHRLNRCGRLSDNYSSQELNSMARLGFGGFALGISTFVYNMIIFIWLQVPILPVEGSSLISGIWCLIVAKSGMLLFWYGRKYGREVEMTPVRTPLLNNQEA